MIRGVGSRKARKVRKGPAATVAQVASSAGLEYNTRTLTEAALSNAIGILVLKLDGAGVGGEVWSNSDEEDMDDG